MWIADGWRDYELLDCGGGEKLERWGGKLLVRPDPQAIWNTPRRNPGWSRPDGRYFRSSTGGGHWDKNKLPENWPIAYKNLRFQVKPMNFKHTGLFPEQAANWDFAMDQIRRAGRPIPDIFAREGEDAFRALETRAVREAGSRTGLVISTGGGVVTRKENRDPLRQNGVIVHLTRPLAALPTGGRPVSQSTDLAVLWQRRAPLYAAFADLTADNSGPLERTLEQIEEALKNR